MKIQELSLKIRLQNPIKNFLHFPGIRPSIHCCVEENTFRTGCRTRDNRLPKCHWADGRSKQFLLGWPGFESQFRSFYISRFLQSLASQDVTEARCSCSSSNRSSRWIWSLVLAMILSLAVLHLF